MADARALFAEAEELLAHEPELRALPADLVWMHAALAHVRGARVARTTARELRALVLAKYVLCVLLALAPVALAWASRAWWLALAAPLAFYAVEAQLVFLVHVVADGSAHPWRDARRRTVDAGGTLSVMATVVPIAVFMLSEGLAGRGFVRSWLTGCLATVLWYEHVRLRRGRAA